MGVPVFLSWDWSSALVIDGGELDAGCTERGVGGGGGWWSRTPRRGEDRCTLNPCMILMVTCTNLERAHCKTLMKASRNSTFLFN